MARKFAGEIAQDLLAAGRKPDEPAAIVANAARADQQVIVTTLGGLGPRRRKCARAGHHRDRRKCELAEELDWLGKELQFAP